MTLNVWEKIEEIRRQPEHIRMRYVFGCLFVSMLFITGIWILSLQESLSAIGNKLPQSIENSKEALSKEQMPSLNSLLEKAAPLRPESASGDEQANYFNEQFKNNAQNTDTEPSATP